MSAHWHLRCLDDGTECGSSINHGAALLRILAKLGPHIATLAAADTDGIIELGLDVNAVLTGAQGDVVGNRDILAWLADHGAHTLELVNEYGDVAPVDEPCPAAFAAVDGVTCDRSLGHPVPHEARVPAGGVMRGAWRVTW